MSDTRKHTKYIHRVLGTKVNSMASRVKGLVCLWRDQHGRTYRSDDFSGGGRSRVLVSWRSTRDATSRRRVLWLATPCYLLSFPIQLWTWLELFWYIYSLVTNLLNTFALTYSSWDCLLTLEAQPIFFAEAVWEIFFRYNSRKCLYYATDAMETDRFETFLQPICNRLIMVTWWLFWTFQSYYK